MSAQAYRRNAADCLRISRIATDPKKRAYYTRMAIAWTDLAERAEKHTRTEAHQPQVLQQQQQPQVLLQQQQPQKDESN